MTDLTDGIDSVDLNDKKVEIQTFDRYKGRKNITDRIAIISSALLRAKIHYHHTKKKTIKCLSRGTEKAICCQVLGEPDQRFGMLIFHYLTDENGDLLVPEKLSGKVKLWIVSESRYAELSTIHKEFPLLDGGKTAEQKDLLIKCTEEAFQKMVFTPCREALWKKKELWYESLKGKETKAKQKLISFLGQTVPDSELHEILDIPVPRSVTQTLTSDDFNIDDIVSGGT